MKTQFGLSDRTVLEVVTYQLPLHYFTTIAASHKLTIFVSLHTFMWDCIVSDRSAPTAFSRV